MINYFVQLIYIMMQFIIRNTCFIIQIPSFYYKTNSDGIWRILMEAEKQSFITAATKVPSDAEK